MSVPSHVIAGLKTRYDEPQRHYHSWAHVEALLRHFETLRAKMSDAGPVLWALYYHDAVYDPKAPDNEEQSAELLRVEAAEHLAADDLQFAYDIIIGTKTHELVGDWPDAKRADMALFLDMDLSILAAPEPVFDQYERDVRAEYAFVPEDAFKAGRAAILKRFLERDRIYYTATCRDRWEAVARANLSRSIEALQGQ